MRKMIISELTQAVQDLAKGFAHYLPRLLDVYKRQGVDYWLPLSIADQLLQKGTHHGVDTHHRSQHRD